MDANENLRKIAFLLWFYYDSSRNFCTKKMEKIEQQKKNQNRNPKIAQKIENLVSRKKWKKSWKSRPEKLSKNFSDSFEKQEYQAKMDWSC
jgi:Txe/YoeB family toxin of Txe-Axe toxin-antitoxin module